MREWSQGISKRREERIRAIKKRKGLSNKNGTRSGFTVSSSKRQPPLSSQWDELPWNQNVWRKDDPKKKESRMLIQAFFAFLLLTVCYLIFQSEGTTARQAQSFIVEVMERDYNFEGVAKWYEQNIGGMPAILPVFKENRENSHKESVSWVSPLKGEVVQPYQKGRKGIAIRAAKGSPVVSAAEGWVVEAGPKEGLGKTVVVRHRDGDETWYGWLGEIQVQEKDWVKPRQLLGEVGEREGETLLFFAVKKGGDFVDPSGVVPVE